MGIAAQLHADDDGEIDKKTTASPGQENPPKWWEHMMDVARALRGDA